MMKTKETTTMTTKLITVAITMATMLTTITTIITTTIMAATTMTTTTMTITRSTTITTGNGWMKSSAVPLQSLVLPFYMDCSRLSILHAVSCHTGLVSDNKLTFDFIIDLRFSFFV